MKKNIGLYIVIILGIIVLIPTLYTRVQIENRNKVVDVVLDYSEFNDMANQSEESLSWWLEKFGQLGVEYVGLQEENLQSLLMDNEDLDVLMGWEVRQELNWNRELANKLPTDILQTIGDYDLLVVSQSAKIFNFIQEGLVSRYSQEDFEILGDNDKYGILIRGNIEDALYKEDFKLTDMRGKLHLARQKPYSSKLMEIGLGFDREKIATIKESGLKVMARPYTYQRTISEKYMEATFADLKDYDIIPPVFIFSGGQVLGYPDEFQRLTEYMLDNEIKAALIENSVQRSHIEQDGLHLLARSLNYDAVRVFSIWPYIQERFAYFNYEGGEEIENTLYRAVTERNIRLVYFKPFKKDGLKLRFNEFKYITDYGEYEKVLVRFKNRIGRHGISLGTSSIMPAVRVRLAKQSLMGWGIVAAGIILLRYLFGLEKRLGYVLLLLGAVTIPMAFIIRPLLADKILALTASIVFPSLAILYFCNKCYNYGLGEGKERKSYQRALVGVKDLIIASAISLLGGLFIGASLSNIEYLLEIDIFRGVKISQLVPILIYLLIYFMYFNNLRPRDIRERPTINYQDIKEFLLGDIKIIYVMIAAILGIVGYVYMARTGHESGIQASNLELMARNLLEEKLLARPRSKEFLIAFPALIMGVYFAKDKIKTLVFLTGLAAVIGQTSITNTFSHLRTPIYLSLFRTFYSLIFGSCLGLVYIVLFEIARRAYRRIYKDGLSRIGNG